MLPRNYSLKNRVCYWHNINDKITIQSKSYMLFKGNRKLSDNSTILSTTTTKKRKRSNKLKISSFLMLKLKFNGKIPTEVIRGNVQGRHTEQNSDRGAEGGILEAAFTKIYLGESLGGPVVRTQAFTIGTQVQSLAVEPRSSKLHRAAKRRIQMERENTHMYLNIYIYSDKNYISFIR